VLVLLSGVGPVIAWRRATLANLRRTMLGPAAFAGAVLALLLVAGGVADKPVALLMFVLSAFVTGTVVQELWRGVRARRAMSSDSWPLAVVSLVRRNRRRYGGYVVHLGVALLFTGIAASSAFQSARDADLRPGQTARSTATTSPTSGDRRRRAGRQRPARAHRPRRRDPDRQGRRDRHDDAQPPLVLPVAGQGARAVSRFFEGEATSEVALEAGLREDVWTVVSPDVRTLLPRVREGDRVFTRAAEGGGLTPEATSALLGEALRGLASSYASDPPPATFRLIVSPLVTWIWIGAIITFLGGLIAMWPTPSGATRRVSAAYAARVARDLGRA
jgi:cytochrome c-type biogenesis protein CcmF